MKIFDAIRAKMMSHQTLSTLVGNRIYPIKLPQSPVYPSITYRRLSGDTQSDIGVNAPVFQFDVWADGYTAADNVAAALIGSLDGEKYISNNIEVIKCKLERTPVDIYDSAIGKNRISLDIKVTYREV